MWTCNNCKRVFKSANQYHICVEKDIGSLFLDKSDEIVLLFDALVTKLERWQPNVYSACVNTIVFTNTKTWLVVKPMKTALDLKIYSNDHIDSELIKTRSKYPNKMAYHIRIKSEDEIDDNLLELLRIGYDYANK